ncbi:MAG: PhoH family protein [bacterium]
MTEFTLQMHFDEPEVARFIFGQRDEHLRLIERSLDISIGARDGDLSIQGAKRDVTTAELALLQLYALGKKGFVLSPADVVRAVEIMAKDPNAKLTNIFLDTIFVTAKNKVISPKGVNQKVYIEAIRKNDVVFGVGPAGTGKTFLAMAMALSALMDKQVKRIILTRPAVEAGERLGFLPGDLQEKIDPYLRPLWDAINDMLDAERAQALLAKGAVEVAPLAFMRGRTLNDAFIVLDEAQNATSEQMKMFLTRIGFGSKAVITGDVTQIDLPRHQRSGLVEALTILKGIPGIHATHFEAGDVVRHPIVQRIVSAYERAADEDAG